MDDLAILINDKITRRGIAKGLVFVQEDLNNNTNNAYNANFNNGYINNNNVNNNNYVRLSVSFIILKPTMLQYLCTFTLRKIGA